MAVAVVGEAKQILRACGAQDEHMPPPVVDRRDERDACAIGRPPWLDVHRAVRGQRGDGTRRHVEPLQLDRIVVVAREDHRLAIGRPIGLVVVSVT